MIVLTTTRIMLIIMLRMLTKTEMKFMMSVIRWMHFKTVHVNTGWMTTADETGDP